MDRLCSGRPRRIQHGVDRQIALRRGGGADPHGDVGEGDVPGSGIGVAVDGDRADAEAAQCRDDAAGDLAAVCDEDGVEHVDGFGMTHLTHIRKTP